MRYRRDYDYYIFLDYSEGLVGYNIIEQKNIINNTIKKNKIKSYFEKIRIVEIRKNLDIFLEILEFVKEKNCSIFISVDDYQYKYFSRLTEVVDGDKNKIVKESELKKDSKEYKLSLVIDNLLNIEKEIPCPKDRLRSFLQ